MKVWQRLLLKTIIFLLVIAVAGGSVAAFWAYRQSTPQYAIDRYLSLLIEDDSASAYQLLDQSEEEKLSETEYDSVVTDCGYGIYASYTVQELEHRRDNDGREYVDYHVTFLNAQEEIVSEEEFTVKLQSAAVFGVFDQWKVLSSHCMVKNFRLSVPTGSEVCVNGTLLDVAWIMQKGADADADSEVDSEVESGVDSDADAVIAGDAGTDAGTEANTDAGADSSSGIVSSVDCYQIPALRRGKASLVIRHSALTSVNTTFEVQGEEADFCDQMPLKKLAESECTELGVSALKALYASAVTEKTDDLKELFADCLSSAKKIAKNQGKQFHQDDSVFKTAAISEFASEFGDVVFTDDETGAITVELKLTYHYVVRRNVTEDTQEDQEEWEVETQAEESQAEYSAEECSGDNTATFTLAFYDESWHITELEIPTIG